MDNIVATPMPKYWTPETQAVSEAMATAIGYAWGRMDAGDAYTAQGSYEFGRAYAWARSEFNAGRRGGSFTTVQNCYDKWQETNGAALDERGL